MELLPREYRLRRKPRKNAYKKKYTIWDERFPRSEEREELDEPLSVSCLFSYYTLTQRLIGLLYQITIIFVP